MQETKRKLIKNYILYPTPGAIDLCLATYEPLEAVIKHFAEKKVQIVSGPVKRTGANGNINSVYINDSDGNLIEIANYLEEECGGIE